MKKFALFILAVLVAGIALNSCREQSVSPVEEEDQPNLIFKMATDSLNPNATRWLSSQLEAIEQFTGSMSGTQAGKTGSVKKIDAIDEVRVCVLDMTTHATFNDFLEYWFNNERDAFLDNYQASDEGEWQELMMNLQSYGGGAFQFVADLNMPISGGMASTEVNLSAGLHYFLVGFMEGQVWVHAEEASAIIVEDSSNVVSFGQPVGYGNVYGAVTDAVSGDPVSGALLVANDGSSTQSDQLGEYNMLVTSGEAILTASHTDYRTASKVATIERETDHEVNFQLTPDSNGGTVTPGEMVVVEGGTFTMGCYGDKTSCDSDETPTHEVLLSNFYIGKYEVTQEEYESIMGSNPSRFPGTARPVEYVSWFDAVAYCNALSEAEGYAPCYTIDGTTVSCDFTKDGYRLPTEAEWEYAARGGILSNNYIYAGSDNVEDVGWVASNASNHPNPVGTKSPNEIGVHDMSGNVSEWCWDWYDSYTSASQQNPTGPPTGNTRVLRGGGFASVPDHCEVHQRIDNYYPSRKVGDIGFRIARSIAAGTTNQPPAAPNTPVPGDAATDVSITPTLEWQCSDPDGDELTYDIYFGESAAPPLTESGYSGTSYTPATLTNSTTYYWKVVAKDGNGGETEGPVWSYTTEAGGGTVTPGEMILVEGGTFTMGCTNTLSSCTSDELPTHEVTLSSFYIGAFEVTQGEYEAVTGTNPSAFSSAANLPVESLSWYDMVEYCNALSDAEGLEQCYVIDGSGVTCDFTKNGYRLPTEAEWEYAARGGNLSQGYIYSGSNNIEDVAWYEGNSSGSTHVVGTKNPNELGIFDMNGNVWEWCWDWYGSYSNNPSTNPTGPSSGSVRVNRGGSFGNQPTNCDISDRHGAQPINDQYFGFRIARTVNGSDWNQPPAAPNTPLPGDAATDVSITPTLEWQCSDPDGDALTYDIYFGETSTPPLAAGGNTGTTYVLPTLNGSTTYYWQIVAKDGQDSTAGPVWSFTTEAGGGTVTPGEMVLVEGGTFTMGCTAEQGDDCGSNETPTHEVTVSSFYIGKYEVTQGEYESVMGTNPSGFSGSDNLPVENLTWYAMVEYCNTLSIAEGLEPCYSIDGDNTTCDFTKNGYRLATEAEWEYAARGGNQSQGYKYSGSDNIEEVAWYYYNSSVDGRRQTHEVGTKSPNELGIYDMSGNVWEWCWDWDGSYSSSSVTNPTGSESGSIRVLRGGSWSGDAGNCRVAFRSGVSPSSDGSGIGFRLARTFDGSDWGQTQDGWQEKMIASFPFNGNADDETGNGNDGTVYGASLQTDRVGSSSSSYYFDGNEDWIDIPDDLVPSNTSDFSICYWFRTSMTNFDIVFNADGTTSGRFGTGINPDGNFHFWLNSTSGYSNYERATSVSVVNDDSWHFAAIVRESGTIKVYIDANLEATADAPSNINTSLDLGIGENSTHISRYPGKGYRGYADDIKFFDAALSNSEIGALYELTTR